MLEPQKRETLGASGEVRDPGLLRVQSQPESDGEAGGGELLDGCLPLSGNDSSASTGTRTAFSLRLRVLLGGIR